MMTSTSLIIVNFNTVDRTVRLVNSVADMVDEVIVVDNASPQGDAASLARLPERHERVRFLAQPDNRGYGAGANAGARVASGDLLLVANPDVEIDGASLRRLVAALSEPGVGLAAPRFVRPDGNLQPSAHRRDPLLLLTFYETCRPFAGLAVRLTRGWHPTLFPPEEHVTSRDCTHVLGAFMALRKDAFDAVGGFDEGFFMYREETDLCQRLREAGWRVRHVADATVVHEGGASTPDRASKVPLYFTSHYRYIAKHNGRATATLARVLGTIGCILWVILGPKRRLARAPLRWHLGLRPAASRR